LDEVAVAGSRSRPGTQLVAGKEVKAIQANGIHVQVLDGTEQDRPGIDPPESPPV